MAKKEPKHPTTTKKVFTSMKKKVKTNPGHGYPHESVPGGSMGGMSHGRRM